MPGLQLCRHCDRVYFDWFARDVAEIPEKCLQRSQAVQARLFAPVIPALRRELGLWGEQQHYEPSAIDYLQIRFDKALRWAVSHGRVSESESFRFTDKRRRRQKKTGREPDLPIRDDEAASDGRQAWLQAIGEMKREHDEERSAREQRFLNRAAPLRSSTASEKDDADSLLRFNAS